MTVVEFWIMAVELMFGKVEKAVLGFCESERLSIWPML